jgi:hypothetical protein
MTTTKAATARVLMGLLAGSLAWGQSPGHVNFFIYANTNFDTYTYAPSAATQQWFNSNIAGMTVFSPYFDSRTSWYSRGAMYQDLYQIQPGSAVQKAHPEWVLKSPSGSWLYMPFNCSGGTCPMYAGDIANPSFRSYWISQTASMLNGGHYGALWIDDVNMEFRVGDGNGNQVAPIDSNTGQVMTYDAWRSYIAQFVAQIRQAFPNTKIMHNTIWFADSVGAWAADPYIQQQISSADYINLERGIASDAGLSGGTGFFSVFNFFKYVDDVHSMGRGVNLMAYQLNTAQQQYNLASYYLISNGNDYVGDFSSNPDNWWTGYNTELGTPQGPRTYSNGVYQRVYSGGMVVLGEPGIGSQTIQLPGSFRTLDGNWVSSVTVGSATGFVLLNGNAAPATVTPSAPTPPPTPPTPGPPVPGGVTRFLSDIAPNYSINGWGNMQVNKSTNGNPLTINGVTYAHGLGVHAYAEQHWPLYGNCSSFTALVGVDGEVPAGFANVDFQVWGDGRLLYNSGFMQSGTPTATVNLNLSGIQQLSLVVTNGIWMAPTWTTPLDHSDWANPVIVCAN